MIHGQRIRVTGIVQGVGFRPTVWRLAQECGLVGRVRNDAEGVLIDAWGKRASLASLVRRLGAESPPLSRIENIRCTDLRPDRTIPDDFRIVESRDGVTLTGIAADAATCEECLAEIFDPDSRRYRYPFTNCTHCGPRLSIIHTVPYDRRNTAMASFSMCESCAAEYHNPADRRFHAQPNGCPECGPIAWLEDGEGKPVSPYRDDVIATTAHLIRTGHIVAIKGIGGYHLACDAGDEAAVRRLRQRKHRYHKPLALLARDLKMMARFAEVDAQAAALLRAPAAPIVVLPATGERLASGLAPGQATLGFALPSTPLHHLLMHDLTRPIVLTSGNRSDEPQVTDNENVHRRLSGIADYYLLHNRDIVNRLDDSVMHLAGESPRFLRRARGYAPQPMPLPRGLNTSRQILAMGAELKNTFCLVKGDTAIMSQHIGDLEDARTYRDYQHNIELYRQLFDHEADSVVVDLHPDYLSTRLGRELADKHKLRLHEVQHHHAHIVSCLAEHRVALDASPVLGIALDGLGFGTDAHLWGGEFLRADYCEFERLARFQPVAMAGGNRAIYEPWRNTWAHLDRALTWEQVCRDWPNLDLIEFLNARPLKLLRTMVRRGVNSPLASSCGRLFDAAAAALGVCREEVSYEGQAAMELESLATPHFGTQAQNAYPFELIDAGVPTLTWAALWRSLMNDLQHHVAPGKIAARFHHCVACAVATTAVALCERHDLTTVALGGGVFQNRLLLEAVEQQLVAQSIRVLSPRQLPANDGGLAFGQALIAAARR